MKYFVIVNQKYLVTVDANTAGGAEHKILDDIHYGIDGCQAFTIEELKTDTFKSMAKNCTTVSFNELLEKSKRYKIILDNIDDLINERSKCDDIISYSKTMILKCKSDIEEAERDRSDFELHIEELRNVLSKVYD